MNTDPYRVTDELPEEEEAEETPEAILFDTLTRLRAISDDEAICVVRSLAAFLGMNVGRGYVESEEVE